LETNPDVGLDVADEVAEVDVAVGVGQGVGNENLAGHGLNFSVKQSFYQSRPCRIFDLPVPAKRFILTNCRTRGWCCIRMVRPT